MHSSSATGRLPSPRSRPRRSQGARALIEALLGDVDVRLDGQRPWDIRIHDPSMPERALAHGTLGLGEAYMDGHWDCERLDMLFDRLIRADMVSRVKSVRVAWHHLRARWFNLQSERRAWQVGQQHYDLGNEFFAAMLDRRMTYTCAWWRDARTLDEAQEAKLDLVCRKLGLEPGMRVLDIGCGWGSFMQFAAERYGVRCVGVTVSAEQVAWASQRCAGLPVEFLLADYRSLAAGPDGNSSGSSAYPSLRQAFDRVVSLGMFEHVGHKNHATFMQVARRCLVDDGLFLLHTIGRNEQGHGTDPWIHKYIFPNGELPTVAQVGAAAERRFVVEDLHNFGADYDRTLLAWHDNVEAAWPRLADRFSDRFRRLWRYYLLSCAGAFRARDIQLWQWVLSAPGRRGVYARLAG